LPVPVPLPLSGSGGAATAAAEADAWSMPRLINLNQDPFFSEVHCGG
jgi:hypothetical protein